MSVGPSGTSLSIALKLQSFSRRSVSGLSELALCLVGLREASKNMHILMRQCLKIGGRGKVKPN